MTGRGAGLESQGSPSALGGLGGGPRCRPAESSWPFTCLFVLVPRTLRRFTHLSQPRRGSPSGCCLYSTELLQVSVWHGPQDVPPSWSWGKEALLEGPCACDSGKTK